MKTLLQALRILLVFTVLTGVLYPLAVTGLGQLVFPRLANGSLISRGDGTFVGSELIAQSFTDPRYFWPRPSAGGFATVASGASNKGPLSEDLKAAIEESRTALRGAHKLPADAPVPDELVTASGSGLDPHISPEAARFQAARVAEIRGFKLDDVVALIAAHTESPQLGILGQSRVNVLKLNVALDTMPGSLHPNEPLPSWPGAR